VTLTATNGSSYQWYRNDTAIAGATDSRYITSLAGVYSVRINDGMCTVPAANTIRVQYGGCIPAPETAVFVPSAFTPNKNGENDVLRPLLYNVNSLRYFKVFNRWGQEVFQTNVIGRGWDGTIKGVPQPTETYTWILECTDNNGKIIKQSGRSLLLR
jgi:gliding motility-associated-like protein